MRYEHDGTKLKQFPLPADRPLDLVRRLDDLAQERAHHQPAALCQRQIPTRTALEEARKAELSARESMIAIQEELDWQCYRLYGLIDEDLTHPPEDIPRVRLGERGLRDRDGPEDGGGGARDDLV